MIPEGAWARERRRRSLALAAGSEEHLEVAGGIVGFSGPESPASVAVGLGLLGGVGPGDVEALVSFHEERGLSCRVEVEPDSNPSLLAALGDRGFRLAGFRHHAARALPADENLGALLPAPRLTALEVAPEDPEPDAAQPWPEVLRRPPEPGARRWLARLRGELAGAGALAVGEASAELSGAWVSPEHRTRGVHAALVAARLEEARARGAEVAWARLAPGDPAGRTLARLGFAVVGTQAILERPRRAPPPPVRVEPLVRHPRLRRRLAALHAAEWRHLYADGWDEERAAAELGAEAPDRPLPRTWVALAGEELVGSVSLVLQDLPERPELDPWLASLLVLPRWRGRGVGTALIRAAESTFGDLGVERFYAFTEGATALFERLGFRRVERTFAAGHPVDLLERTVPRGAGR